MSAPGHHIIDHIGNTPLIQLTCGCDGPVFLKAEFLNPGGSIKDRVAKQIIENAEAAGEITPGKTTIVEATSGNTGIGVALVGRQKGYRVVLVLPEQMSEERKKIIRALGAELVLYKCDAQLDLCLNKVAELMQELPDAWEFGQFHNPGNPQAHYEHTGPEIWEQIGGKVDILVAGVGSGGTLTGVGRFLREQNPNVQIVAVEPRSSAALLGREPGLHQIQGIGDGFVPPVLDRKLIDMMITVTDDDAIATTRELARDEGLLVGTSTGANVWAARQLARSSKTVVTIAPDRAERYFSTSLI